MGIDIYGCVERKVRGKWEVERCEEAKQILHINRNYYIYYVLDPQISGFPRGFPDDSESNYELEFFGAQHLDKHEKDYDGWGPTKDLLRGVTWVLLSEILEYQFQEDKVLWETFFQNAKNLRAAYPETDPKDIRLVVGFL